MTVIQFIIFYPIILTLGALTSYTDIRFREIKNIHIIYAMLGAFAAHALSSALLKNVISVHLLLNLLIGISIGLMLYFTGSWGAGDAKLFIVFCLLMPMEKYSNLFPFPSVVIFINCFLISTLALFICSFIFIIQSRQPILKLLFNKQNSFNFLVKSVGGSFCIIFCLGWIIMPIILSICPQITRLSQIIIVFLFYFALHKALNDHIKSGRVFLLVLGLGLLARILFQSLDFVGMNFLLTLKYTAFYSLFYQCLRGILSFNSPKEGKYKNIPFAPLIFLGTLLTNTNFLNIVMNIMSTIR